MARLRCVNCRGYYPKEAMLYRSLAAVCSEECLTEWTLKRIKKNRKPKKRVVPAKRRVKRGIPAKVRARVHLRDHELCRNCKRRGTQLHHVIFRSAGGPDCEQNLILLCFRCHQAAAHGVESRKYRRIFQGWLYCFYTFEVERSLVDVEAELDRDPEFLESIKGFVESITSP